MAGSVMLRSRGIERMLHSLAWSLLVVIGVLVADVIAETATGKGFFKQAQASEPERTISRDSVTKKIGLMLEYYPGSVFDIDDDGVETEESAIDYTVAGSRFSWEADQGKLCTNWQIDSLDNEISAVVCNGARNCCNLFELEPRTGNWDEPFYAFRGAFNNTVGYYNDVHAYVVYADYDLETLGAKVDVVSSERKTVQAMFFPSLKQ